MLRPRTLLAVLASLAAAGLIWWLLGDAASPRGSDPLRGESTANDDDPQPADPLRAEGTDGAAATNAAPSAPRDYLAERVALLGVVTGRVVDERGRGLGSATVEVHAVDPRGLRGAPYADRERLASTTTERDGSFSVEAQTHTWLRLVAHAPGRARIGQLVASAGADVLLVLPLAGTVSVDVVDADGKAVHGASLRAESGQSVQHAEAADGHAVLDALPPGSLRLRVSAPGRGTVLAGPVVVVAARTVAMTVVVPEAVRVRGTVLDEATSKPVAGARVFVAQPGQAVEAAPTDTQGRFGPVSGGGVGQRVFLSVEAEGYAPLLQDVILRVAPEQTVELRLVGAEAWTGRVVDAGGAPVAEAIVGYTHDGIDRAALVLFGLTDAEGRFTLPPPAPPAPGRRVVLTARSPEGLGALALRPGMLRPDPLVLTLAPGAAVSGRVVSAAGPPLAGVTVRLIPAWGEVRRGMQPDAAASRLLAANEEGFLGLSTATDGAGAWVLRGVQAGPYRVLFANRGVEQRRAELLHVNADGATAGTETLHGGRTLSGVVLDARGAGLAGVRVAVAPADDPRAGRRTTTDADGHFAVDGLAPGAWTVGASYPGRPPLRAETELGGDEDAHVVLQVADPALLTGTVRRRAAPYSGLLTLAFGESASGRAAARRRAVRVTGGQLRIEDPPPGRWTVEAFGAGGLRAQAFDVEIDPGREASLVLDLVAGARLNGRVLTADGRPVPTARLVLSQEATGARHLGTADADGRYVFDGLVAGTYALAVSGRGGAATQESLTLGQGAAIEREIRLAAGGAAEILVLDERQRPVAEARLSFATDAGTVRTVRPVRTDRSGVGVQADLPLGDLVVRARDAQGREGFARTIIEAGRNARVEIQVRPRER